MNHLGTKTLETDRLILRAFVPEDASAMYRNWAGDPEVTKYLTWPTHESEAVSAQVIADWARQNGDPKFYQWAIVWKKSMEAIGSISVVHMDESIRQAEVGYCIGRPWWHQKVTTECFSAVIRFLFEEAEFNRIAARHDPRNPHSGMVMKKCGLRYEGTHRQAARNNQGICDISIYAILREDYNFEEIMFLNTDFLRNDEIKLVLEKTADANPEKNRVPAYHFAICDHSGTKLGICDLRIGHNEQLYYGGNIGYRIEEPYRGHHYAGKACLLLFELARKHNLGYLIITCNPDNHASRKTCEYAGGELLEVAELPQGNDMRENGESEKCIFRFNL